LVKTGHCSKLICDCENREYKIYYRINTETRTVDEIFSGCGRFRGKEEIFPPIQAIISLKEVREKSLLAIRELENNLKNAEDALSALLRK